MATATEPAPSRLLNRELSWVEFSARVLELAEDERLPLLERVKFAAIFSQGLDEFFMVRVAGLLELDEADVQVRSVDGLGAGQALDAIRERVAELTARQGRLWKRDLAPALAEAGIDVATIDDCSEREQEKLGKFFEREVFPILTPLAVGPGQPFPYVSGLSLSLGVIASDPETGDERFARVKVPEVLDRFVRVGKRLVPLESVIAYFLPMLFPGMEIAERALFRVTRDADFELSDDADDLLEAVESELRRRRFGDVVRLEVSRSASRAMRERLIEGLDVRPGQVYEIEGLLDQSELWQLVALDRPDLKPAAWAPVVPPRWARAAGGAEVFDEIRRGDLLVQQPYDSFRASFEAFAQAAARDRDVIAIKTAVYRTSDESSLVSSLIESAEQGKESVCLVELKARFDERRNIEWSREMEEAGVHVVHGFPDLKIHAKMTLVIRREQGGLRRYVHIGTGNYNASTARVYEDVGLFTADEEISADVADLFNYVTGFGRPQRFRKLLVAPFTMRARLVEEIRRVAAAAADGAPTRIRLKLNALVDPTIVEELYAASAAGVPIEIQARSICMLRAGVKGLSETVRVTSIVDRFLEHSRIYWFEAGRRDEHLHGERRPHAEEPRPTHRGAHPRRERAREGRDRRHPRQRVRRHDEHLGARPRRRVDPARGQGQEGARPPGGDDAPRPASRPPSPLLVVGPPCSAVRRDGDHRPVRVGVLDVGSNTARLLVADIRPDGSVTPIATESTHLGLGAEIAESGTLRSKTIAVAAGVCRRYAKRAQALGAVRAEVIVTAPAARARPPPPSSPRSPSAPGSPCGSSPRTRKASSPTAARSRVSSARRRASSASSTSAAARPRSSSAMRTRCRRGSGRSTSARSGSRALRCPATRRRGASWRKRGRSCARPSVRFDLPPPPLPSPQGAARGRSRSSSAGSSTGRPSSRRSRCWRGARRERSLAPPVSACRGPRRSSPAPSSSASSRRPSIARSSSPAAASAKAPRWRSPSSRPTTSPRSLGRHPAQGACDGTRPRLSRGERAGGT